MKPGDDDSPEVCCPACGEPTTMLLGATQALCMNDSTENRCNVIFFNPSLPDGGMSSARVLDFSGGQAAALFDFANETTPAEKLEGGR